MDAHDSRALVSALHEDLLGRPADASRLDRVGVQLQTHDDVSRVVSEFMGSSEYHDRAIASAYELVSRRSPQARELAEHRSNLAAGRERPSDIAFRVLYGVFLDDSVPAGARLAAAYEVAHGREISVPEVDHWSAHMRERGPSQTLRDIWQNAEAKVYRVALIYRSHLWRDPDHSGVTTWGPILDQHGDEPVRAGLASSLEYLVLARRRAGSSIPDNEPAAQA